MENKSFTKAKEFGKTRVEFAKNAKSKEDWDKWAKPENDFAFDFADCWNQCIEYKVADFQSEVGFFIDTLGCDCNSISENYAMFMGPKKEFFFAVRTAKENETTTPRDAITLEFMVKDINATMEKLRARGIQAEEEVQADEPGSPMFIASFRSPNEIKIKLWSFQPDLAKPQ